MARVPLVLPVYRVFYRCDCGRRYFRYVRAVEGLPALAGRHQCGCGAAQGGAPLVQDSYEPVEAPSHRAYCEAYDEDGEELVWHPDGGEPGGVKEA